MEAVHEIKKTSRSTDEEKRKYKIRAAAFLGTVSGMAAIAGFSRTITTARKQDQKLYEKTTVETANLIEAGTKLATRALAWGTFYAIVGTGTFFYGLWKLSGAVNMNEFRHKVGSVLPRLSKEAQSGRTDFDGLNDLMEYVSSYEEPK